MSYVVLGGFGTIDPTRLLTFASDVYVLRLKVRGAVLTDPSQALAFAKAAGQGQNLGLDVRGVALWKAPGMTEDQWMVDVVETVTSGGVIVPFVGDNASAMATKVAANADLRARFPKIAVDTASALWGTLSEPVDAIDWWRRQPMLWDHALADGGGPTDTFANPAEYSVVLGKADDGAKARPWKRGEVPVAPPRADESGSGWGWLAALGLGAVVIGGVAYARRGRGS